MSSQSTAGGGLHDAQSLLADESRLLWNELDILLGVAMPQVQVHELFSGMITHSVLFLQPLEPYLSIMLARIEA